MGIVIIYLNYNNITFKDRIKFMIGVICVNIFLILQITYIDFCIRQLPCNKEALLVLRKNIYDSDDKIEI